MEFILQGLFDSLDAVITIALDNIFNVGFDVFKFFGKALVWVFMMIVGVFG